METSTPTFDQLPHVVSGLSEKLDRVLDILEKLGIANPIKNVKPSRRLVYAKEACQIIGKSLSSLYRGIKAPNDPIPSYKRGKLLYFYEDELYAWIRTRPQTFRCAFSRRDSGCHNCRNETSSPWRV